MNIIIATLVILAALTGFQYLICCALRSGSEHDDKLAHLYSRRTKPPVTDLRASAHPAKSPRFYMEHGTADFREKKLIEALHNLAHHSNN